MDWKILQTPFIALICAGIGYWIRAKIEIHKKEKVWKKQYCLEDLKKQRELLLEFLGKPKSDFTILHGVGNTQNEDWRKSKVQTISDWIEIYRPRFPDNIRKALTTIANIAGSMVLNESQKVVQGLKGFEATTKSVESIEKYVDEINKKLDMGN